MQFVFLSLAYFNEQSAFWLHTLSCKFHDFIFLYGYINFHSVYVPCFLYPCICLPKLLHSQYFESCSSKHGWTSVPENPDNYPRSVGMTAVVVSVSDFFLFGEAFILMAQWPDRSAFSPAVS